jgi:hypothetical protein
MVGRVAELDLPALYTFLFPGASGDSSGAGSLCILAELCGLSDKLGDILSLVGAAARVAEAFSGVEIFLEDAVTVIRSSLSSESRPVGSFRLFAYVDVDADWVIE